MTLLSAHQDFVQRTLITFDSVMERLRYIAGLRTKDGKYEHWGLARIHGEAAAQAAMLQAHRETLLDVLRTPVRELFRQASRQGAETLPYSADAQLLPLGTSAATAAHFSSTVHALNALARARAKSTHQVA